MYARRLVLIVLLCAALFWGGCSAHPPAPAQETPPAPTANPAPSPRATPEPAEPIIDLPAPNADGMRAYRYGGQPVNDWLGDFPGADKIRGLLLAYMDEYARSRGGTYLTDDFFYLFLGRSVEVPDGWIVPAGKELGGEWMPDLYYITKEGPAIQSKSRFGDVWTINRSCVKTADGGTYTAYFGVVPTDDRLAVVDENAHALRVDIQADKHHDAIDVPPHYPYFLCVTQGVEPLQSISVFDVTKNAFSKLSLDFMHTYPTITPENVAQVLRANYHPSPMVDIRSDMPWEDVPEIRRAEVEEPYTMWGGIYACNLVDESYMLSITAHSPLDQACLERSHYVHIGPERNVILSIDGKGFGEPSKMDAVLYTPYGQKPLLYEQGRIETGELEPKDYARVQSGEIASEEYVLYVRAEFGPAGYVEWMLVMVD